MYFRSSVFHDEFAGSLGSVLQDSNTVGPPIGLEDRFPIEELFEIRSASELVEDGGEEIEVGRRVVLYVFVLEFIEDGNASLVPIEVGAVEEGSFFEKFFSVIACDGDEGVLV